MKIMKKGTEVKKITCAIPENLVTRLKNGNYVFNCDVYVLTIHNNITQVKKVIPEKSLGHDFIFWPNLRKALHLSNQKSIWIPLCNNPIHYYDELAIADFETKGYQFFIIKKEDIGKYLGKLN